eukprot:COSAG06_NODE_7330_length_2543_cov_126.607494_3_plen_171_part_00
MNVFSIMNYTCFLAFTACIDHYSRCHMYVWLVLCVLWLRRWPRATVTCSAATAGASWATADGRSRPPLPAVRRHTHTQTEAYICTYITFHVSRFTFHALHISRFTRFTHTHRAIVFRCLGEGRHSRCSGSNAARVCCFAFVLHSKHAQRSTLRTTETPERCVSDRLAALL